MILIGMFDSPFVRRVAVSMRLLDIPFEHRNWSVGKDQAEIRRFNPLGRVPTLVLRHPEFAIWCGTERTADWHTRFGAAAVVYGHLHIPRTTWEGGVRFEEVSIGYPREWKQHHLRRGVLRDVLPTPAPEVQEDSTVWPSSRVLR